MGILLGFIGIVSIMAADTVVPIVQVSNLKYSYDQMQQDLAALQERYPGQMVVDSLGTTADGRDITEVILGDVDAEHHILIQATMHAREYMNTVLAMNQIEDYLSGSENRSYADQTWKANAEGVDLNRNFDAGWDTYIGASGPSTECYKGTAPASEPEAQAVLSVAQNYDLDCCIAYHSYGNLIYWNYGSQDTVLDADQRLAQCVSDVTGYEMHSTVQDSTDAAGCSDYFVLNLGIPAVTIENGGSECPMPIEEYQPMYQRNQDLWAAVACLYKNS